MSGNAPSIYRSATLPRSLVWSRNYRVPFTSQELVIDENASAADVLAQAGSQEAIDGIEGWLAFQHRDTGENNITSALYVIQDKLADDVCKIGQTVYPHRRLNDLQIATWRKLGLAAIFYPVKGTTYNLEQAVLAQAREDGDIIRGEWVQLTAEDAVALILRVARKRKQLICGCDVWIENMAARVRGLQVSRAKAA